MQAKTYDHEYRIWLRIRMTDAERAAYRSEHAIADGDPTRAGLIGTAQTEIDGLGSSSGWWHEVHAS